MNQDTFSLARQSYASKDYQNALLLFTNCLQDGMAPLQPGEVGLVYHQIGNCLVKLGNGAEAVNAYLQALNDSAYGAAGAVCYNLGTTYASLRDFEDAAKYFEKAVVDQSYSTPYKAYAGLGNAYLKLGKSAEAGIAFREAALDPSNPNPSRALMNLGVCFMALDRPADAVTSYESALQFDMDSDLNNMIHANLGQAYVSMGRMQDAVDAFEEALSDKTYFLSDSASVDYQRAIGAVSQGTSDLGASAQQGSGSPQNFQDFQDVQEGEDDPYRQYYVDSYGDQDMTMVNQPVQGADGYHDQLGQDAFFNASEEDIENWARGQEKMARKKKHTGLKVFLVILIILLLLVGGAVFAYTQGYGYPTQSSSVTQLFEDPSTSSEVFSSTLTDSEKSEICSLVSTCSNVKIDAVERGMSESTVYATGTTSKGGEVHFKITMVRDLAGWKVSAVSLFFLSQGTSDSTAGTTSASSSGGSSNSYTGSSSSSTGSSSSGSTGSGTSSSSSSSSVSASPAASASASPAASSSAQ